MGLRCGGVVLCGGQSRRMGRAKALLPFRDEAMLVRVVRILSEVVDPIVVVAAPEQELPALPGTVIIAYDQETGRGPLQGISAGLGALAGRVDAAFVSSCDVPLLRPDFVRRMLGLLGENEVCAPYCNAIHHPLAAVYRISAVNVVDRLLAENRLRPVYLFDELPTRIVTALELCDVDPNLQSLWNLNTPEDYEAALRESGGAT